MLDSDSDKIGLLYDAAFAQQKAVEAAIAALVTVSETTVRAAASIKKTEERCTQLLNTNAENVRDIERLKLLSAFATGVVCCAALEWLFG